MTYAYVSPEATPETMPLALDEVRAYLRIDHTEEDPLLESLIRTASEVAVDYMRRSLTEQQWRAVYHDNLEGEVRLPMGPVQRIDRVQLVTHDGVVVDVDEEDYDLCPQGRLLLVGGVLRAKYIEILYIAGFNGPLLLPHAIRQGLLLHVAMIYDGRASAARLPHKVRGWYEPFRAVRV